MKYFETIVEQRTIPGVLSFSATGTLLYMNKEATDLSRQMMGASSDGGSVRMVSTEVKKLCLDLQNVLSGSVSPQEYVNIEYRQVIGNVPSPVLLRGFLLPNFAHLEDTRLLVLIEKIGRRNQHLTRHTKDRFNLTNREQDIINYLTQGRTNKEIAQDLNISEHTVKEHIRHLLRKTHSSSRTAILAHLFNDS